MESSEFDKFAAEYCALHAANMGISGEHPEYFAEYKIADLAREYQSRHDGVSPAILDFGAGIGTSVPFLRKHLPGARLKCIDVSKKSLELGERRFPGQAQFLHFDGKQIPFADSSMDIVFAACVFHHISHDEHAALYGEFHRVLRSRGMALVYEHNPYNPLTVHTVKACPFDENAQLIAASSISKKMKAVGFSQVRVRYRVFFPRFLRALRNLEHWMTWLPLGAQYYVLAVK